VRREAANVLPFTVGIRDSAVSWCPSWAVSSTRGWAGAAQAWRDGVRAWPCRLYAFAAPNEAALCALAALGPLVEVGAGAGYWARLLKMRGAQVGARRRSKTRCRLFGRSPRGSLGASSWLMREPVLSQTQVLPLDVHPQGGDAPNAYHGHTPPHVKGTSARSLNRNHPTRSVGKRCDPTGCPRKWTGWWERGGQQHTAWWRQRRVRLGSASRLPIKSNKEEENTRREGVALPPSRSGCHAERAHVVGRWVARNTVCELSFGERYTASRLRSRVRSP
jgi:hypothetical protein